MKTVKEILEEKKKNDIDKKKKDVSNVKNVFSGNVLIKYCKSKSLKKTVNVNVETNS